MDIGRSRSNSSRPHRQPKTNVREEKSDMHREGCPQFTVLRRGSPIAPCQYTQ